MRTKKGEEMCTKKRCIGFDENGRGFDCPNAAGTPLTPLWCPACDRRRITRITRQLEDLAGRLKQGRTG